MLFSYIYSHRDGDSRNFFDIGPDTFTTDNPLLQDTNQFETQYIFKQDWFNVVAGFSYSHIDTTENVAVTVDGIPLPSNEQNFGTDDFRGYAYANINIPKSVTWTVGVSYAHFDEARQPPTEVGKVNPKFGVQWDITSDLRFRAAYIETVKPSLAANRTLEPTEVAGFNQFFDEVNGTKSCRYGVGLDWQATPDLAIGAEMTWRNIGEPFIDASGAVPVVIQDDASERLHQVYLYWTPWDEVAVRAGFVYDKYEKDSAAFSARVGSDNPLEVDTISVPLSISYFHPSGFFATAGVSFVHQKVERLAIFSNQGEDSFFVVDAGIGYRFPDRFGIATLTVHNLLNNGFQFQDDSFREFSDEPTVGPYIPARTILGRVALSF